VVRTLVLGPFHIAVVGRQVAAVGRTVVVIVLAADLYQLRRAGLNAERETRNAGRVWSSIAKHTR